MLEFMVQCKLQLMKEGKQEKAAKPENYCGKLSSLKNEKQALLKCDQDCSRSEVLTVRGKKNTEKLLHQDSCRTLEWKL